MKKSNYGALDIFRLIAALLVIAIHTSPLEFFSPAADFFLTRVLARIAVPFFFMVTGQFVLSRIIGCKDGAAVLKKFLVKNGFTYLIAILLYFPFGLYLGQYKGIGFGGFLKDIIYDGTFYHLWYFPACILGVLIVYVLNGFLGKKGVLITVFVLYIIGVFGDSWYGAVQNVPVLSDIYDGFFAASSYTRNGVFFAPLFLVLGAYMSRLKSRPKGKASLILSAAALGLMTAEGFILRAADFLRHDSMYLMLPFYVFFFYGFLLSLEVPPNPKARNLSKYIYILHPISIMGVREMGRIFKITNVIVDIGIIHYVLVTVITFAISIGWIEIWKMVRKRLQKKFAKH